MSRRGEPTSSGGWAGQAALDSVADDLDIYLFQPSWVDPASNDRVPMTNVDGVLIRESSILYVQVQP